MNRNHVAIACQGGGSQTAFTAGVLKALLENDLHRKKKIVGLSGTSGGAICATLTWCALTRAAQNNDTPRAQPLVDFWRDNSTQCLHEDLFNHAMVGALRLIEGGFLPRWATSPSNAFAVVVWPYLAAMLPHPTFYDLRKLLESHIDFKEIAAWDGHGGPALLIGAADVLRGEFRKFNSRKREINVETLLASAAVPNLFPAVQIGDSFYWDGLFSDNPPTDELLDEDAVGRENLPDELWVIQINPQTRTTIPVLPGEIADRRNEMIGNQSLLQDIQKINMINRFLEEDAFAPAYQDKYRPVQLRIIGMSPQLQERLDYATKLDRSRTLIAQLMQDGESQGRRFLADQGLA